MYVRTRRAGMKFKANNVDLERQALWCVNFVHWVLASLSSLILEREKERGKERERESGFFEWFQIESNFILWYSILQNFSQRYEIRSSLWPHSYFNFANLFARDKHARECWMKRDDSFMCNISNNSWVSLFKLQYYDIKRDINI